MTTRSRTTPTATYVSRPLKDEESTVRERTPPAHASPGPSNVAGSDNGLGALRTHRTSDPKYTLGERLESKLGQAAVLLARLEPQDARARLLHIAMLRRDEPLLDGILAELALPPRTTRRPR